jgi:hypothetical protein
MPSIVSCKGPSERRSPFFSASAMHCSTDFLRQFMDEPHKPEVAGL